MDSDSMPGTEARYDVKHEAGNDGIHAPLIPAPARAKTRMPLYKKISLRLLLALLGSSLVPAAAVVWMVADRAEQAAHDEACRMLQGQAGNSRRAIADFVSRARFEIKQASLDVRLQGILASCGPAVSEDQSVTLTQFLTASFKSRIPGTGEVFVIGPAGTVLASTVSGRVGDRCEAADYFIEGRRSAYVGDVSFDPVIQKPSWVIAAPVVQQPFTAEGPAVGPVGAGVRADGAFLGVLAVRIDPVTLASFTSTADASPKRENETLPKVLQGRSLTAEQIYIVSRGGEMIIDPAPSRAILTQKVDTKAVRMARESSRDWIGSYSDYRGVAVIGAAAPLPGLGWIVVAETGYDVAMARANSEKKTLFSVAGGLLVLLLLAAFLVTRSLLEPVRILLHAEEKFAYGDSSNGLMSEDNCLDEGTRELIRNRNHAIRQVLDSERRYHGLVDEIDGIAWEAEVGSWRFTFVNRRAEVVLGYPVEQWLSGPGFWVKHLHPLDRSRVVQAYLEASITDKNIQIEYRMLAADSRAVWLSDRAHLAGGTSLVDGRPVRLLRGLMMDVTSEHESRELIQDSERRSRLIIESSRDAIIGIDSGGLVSVFNPAAEKMFQVAAREMLKSTTARLIPEELRTRHSEAMSRHLETGRSMGVIGTTVEMTGLRSDGTLFPFEMSLTQTRDKTLRVLAVIKDITERKQAEEKLRCQYQHLEVTRQLTGSMLNAQSTGQIYDDALSCVEKRWESRRPQSRCSIRTARYAT